MGAFTVPVEIGDPAGQRFEAIDALVDTGSIYTWVPRNVLGRLSVRPTDERMFQLADGREVPYPVAWLTIRLQGKVQPTLVVFGDEDTMPLLGVVTLEEYSVGVDPMNQRLVPIVALLKAVR